MKAVSFDPYSRVVRLGLGLGLYLLLNFEGGSEEQQYKEWDDFTWRKSGIQIWVKQAWRTRSQQ